MNEDAILRESGAPSAPDFMAPPAQAAEAVSRQASDHIGWTLMGGLAAGLVVGALLPHARRRKQPKTARTIATTLAASISELSQALIAQALDRAGTAAHDGRDKLDTASHAIGKSLHDHSESLSKQTRLLTDDAAAHMNTGAKAIAKKAVELIEKIRR